MAVHRREAERGRRAWLEFRPRKSFVSGDFVRALPPFKFCRAYRIFVKNENRSPVSKGFGNFVPRRPRPRPPLLKFCPTYRIFVKNENRSQVSKVFGNFVPRRLRPRPPLLKFCQCYRIFVKNENRSSVSKFTFRLGLLVLAPEDQIGSFICF